MSVPDSVAVWTLRTGGVGAFGTKGLLNHHIAAATERETFHCFPLSEIFFLLLLNDHVFSCLLHLEEVKLYKLQLISSLSLLAHSCLTPCGS